MYAVLIFKSSILSSCSYYVMDMSCLDHFSVIDFETVKCWLEQVLVYD